MKSRDNIECIAIVGMSGRFPGARNLKEFWHNLTNGVESITEFSIEELSDRGVSEDYLSSPTYVRKGAPLENFDCFDADFFNISSREAEIMDPQQRLFIESAWEALEHAGYGNAKERSQVGVYAGASSLNYLLSNVYHLLDVSSPSKCLKTWLGNDKDYLATRTSYYLNLDGPSIGVQTACSTSLVSVNLACQGLLTYQCELAIAGGVTVAQAPATGYFYEEGNIVSPDGHCRTFDAEAQGTVFGDGVGVVVLKRLEDAIADRDTIHAVILGSAVNNDGSLKVGYTAPSIEGQADVIAMAQAIAGVDSSTIGYIEAHGTGTSLGDPIEVKALTQVFQAGLSPADAMRSLPRTKSCGLGSVKTNIGHLNGAAGIAGLLKIVLALKHGQIPPSLNFNKPNPLIDFDNSPFYVNTELKDWSKNGTPRRAGISSFGIGGTNVHMIVEEFSGSDETAKHGVERPMHLLTLSAKSNSALRKLANRYINFLDNNPTVKLGDLCFTANHGRERLTYGLATIAASQDQLQQSLRNYLNISNEEKTPNSFDSNISGLQWHGKIPQSLDRVIFLFSDLEEPNIKAIAKELYETQPTFAAVVNHCEQILQSQQTFSLINVLFGDLENKTRTEQTCSVLVTRFVLDYGLAQLWISWGVKPQALGATGNGSYAAAAIANVLSLDDTLQLIYVQGNEEALSNIAFQVTYCSPSVDIINTETGESINSEISTPEYWLSLKTNPNQTSQTSQTSLRNITIPTLESSGYQVFLEMSATNSARRGVSQENTTWLNSFSNDVSVWQSILSTLARFYSLGVKIDWFGFDKNYSRHRIPLPTYPFERQKHWIIPPSDDLSSRSKNSDTSKIHPLLNHPQNSPFFQGILFESKFNTKILPFLEDHQIYNQVVVSGALFLSMLLDAAERVQNSWISQISAETKNTLVLENIIFPQPLSLPDSQTRTVQLLVDSEQKGRQNCQIVSSKVDPNNNTASISDAWLVHSQAEMLSQFTTSKSAETPILIAEVQQRAIRQVAPEELFEMLLQHQVTLKQSHKWICDIWQGEGEALCKLELPDKSIDTASYLLHPGLIDSCFQVLGVNTLSEGNHPETFVPFSIESFQFYQCSDQTSLWCYAQLEEADISSGKLIGNLQLLDQSGQLIAVAKQFESRRASKEVLQRSIQSDNWEKVYDLNWVPQELNDAPKDHSSVRWLILTELEGKGLELALRLEARGDICTIIAPYSSQQSKNKNIISLEVRHFDPDSPKEFRDLLQSTLTDANYDSYHGIIYCASPNANAVNDWDSCDRSQFADCSRVLDLLKGLADFYSERQVSYPSLWLITQGAQAVGLADDERLNPQQAPLWGIGRVAGMEFADLPLRLLDLDLDLESTAEQLTFLISELDCENEESQVAWRQGERYVLRLNHRPHDRQTTDLVIHQEGSYLIAGGLGALGLMMAQRLIDLGVKSLILIGRREPSPAAQIAINKLKQHDVSVRVCSVDISQFKEVESLIEMINQELPPLRGLINAAGTLDDGIILQQSWERYWKVMQSKIVGTWNLHHLTQTQNLDFFVCFSSAAALLGSPGQSNYAAANAFMDTLMHVRRAKGLPGLSVNWGSWATEGMSAQLEDMHQKRSASFGLSPLPMDTGWMLLKELMANQFGDSPVSQVAVIDLDWSRYVSRIPAHARLFLSDLPITFKISSKSDDQPGFVLDLLDIPLSEQRKHLEVHVRGIVSNLLGLSLEKLDNNQSLFDLGLDSLMAVDLRRVLENSINHKLSSVIVFDYPTVSGMIEYLATEVLQLDFAVEAQSSASLDDIKAGKEKSKAEAGMSELSEHLDELSENELANLLEQKLNSL